MALRLCCLACLFLAPLVAAETDPLAQSDNLIDRFVYEKLSADGVPHAPLSSDEEFLRRVYLDLTGRLPEPAVVEEFLADDAPNKRDELIDSLFPPMPRVGLRSKFDYPVIDRWTFFFGDLFKNGQLLEEGINVFREYIYKSLVLNVPYDEFVRDMITASTVSTWADGAANMIARWHVFEFDGYIINHEDTCDEIAINTSKMFLGINLECISCHDGAGHLEKVNLGLAKRKRDELWRQAAFFAETYIAPTFGRSPQFSVKDTEDGYDISTKSALRPNRYKADLTPTFFMNGEQPKPGESRRQAYARLLTSDPQFARATVNLFWTEIVGEGFIDHPFGFDLARQDPANPPPEPWGVQPSHPELLDALAKAFEESGYDLRWLMKTITKSKTYQLSSQMDVPWKPAYEGHFARRQLRRLSAEQLFDGVADAAGVHREIKIRYDVDKASRLMEIYSPQDLDRSGPENRDLANAAAEFGQCDRYTREASREATMSQAAMLLNGGVLKEWVKVQKGGRLERLLKADPPKSNDQIVEELYLATLSRPPSAEERAIASKQIAEYRENGAEDVLWALANSLEFLFY